MSTPDAQRDASELRSDARASRARILEAARTMMGDRRMSMIQLAAAADVGRSTLYRHFPDREALMEALAAEPDAAVTPDANLATLAPHPPGRLGSARPLALEVTHILDEVPPHLVADQLVAEARRAAAAAVALYIADIDGSRLIRLAGSEDFPAELDAPPALGPEIVPEGLPRFASTLRETLPGCVAVPLWLRGRVLGLLLSVGPPLHDLEDIAKQGAAALELAGDYSDFVESVRRRKPTTASAEVQQQLLPPRLVRVTGAQIAGGLLPSYEVGGDWFDYVENRDGAWIAVAEATTGAGPTAAGLGATALGALRAARRAGGDLVDAATAMDDVVRRLGAEDFTMAAVLARWHAPTGTLAWVVCGRPGGAWVIDDQSELEPLPGPPHAALGEGEQAPEWQVQARRLTSGQRLLIVTDGITERVVEDGVRFGEQGVREAVAAAPATTAAATALAVQDAVARRWREPLADDATLVALSVD